MAGYLDAPGVLHHGVDRACNIIVQGDGKIGHSPGRFRRPMTTRRRLSITRYCIRPARPDRCRSANGRRG